MNNIDILEEYLDKQDRKYVSEYRLMILNAIETLIAENKELKEEIEELKKYEKYYEEMEEVNKKFIAVDKIKAKIEEVKDGTYDAKIVLQSLLGKE